MSFRVIDTDSGEVLHASRERPMAQEVIAAVVTATGMKGYRATIFELQTDENGKWEKAHGPLTNGKKDPNRIAERKAAREAKREEAMLASSSDTEPPSADE